VKIWIPTVLMLIPIKWIKVIKDRFNRILMNQWILYLVSVLFFFNYLSFFLFIIFSRFHFFCPIFIFLIYFYTSADRYQGYNLESNDGSIDNVDDGTDADTVLIFIADIVFFKLVVRERISNFIFIFKSFFLMNIIFIRPLEINVVANKKRKRESKRNNIKIMMIRSWED
jgi:hypothetical protein